MKIEVFRIEEGHPDAEYHGGIGYYVYDPENGDLGPFKTEWEAKALYLEIECREYMTDSGEKNPPLPWRIEFHVYRTLHWFELHPKICILISCLIGIGLTFVFELAMGEE